MLKQTFFFRSIISNHNADFNNSCPNIKPSTENTISTNKTQFSNPLSANHRVTDNCLKRKINEEKVYHCFVINFF